MLPYCFLAGLFFSPITILGNMFNGAHTAMAERDLTDWANGLSLGYSMENMGAQKNSTNAPLMGSKAWVWTSRPWRARAVVSRSR